MISLFINILLLAGLAVFVALNVPYTTGVNLFGYVIDEISTVAVIICSILAGVVGSFIFYLADNIKRSGKKRQKKRLKELKARSEQPQIEQKTEIELEEQQSQGSKSEKKSKKQPALFDRFKKKR